MIRLLVAFHLLSTPTILDPLLAKESEDPHQRGALTSIPDPTSFRASAERALPPLNPQIFSRAMAVAAQPSRAARVRAAISEQQLLGEAYRMAKLTNLGDHAWAMAEAMASTTAVLLYLNQFDHIPLDQALLPAVASGVLSYGFQIFFPQYVRWVNQEGIFKISDEVKSSFLGTLGKEYLLQIFYVGVVHLASVSMGIETLGSHFFDTAFLAWLGEGSFSLIIAKITERLPMHFPGQPKFAWNLGKASFFTLGIWSSLLMISNLSSAEFSHYAYWIMSVVGIPAYFWMANDLKEFKESLRANFSKISSPKDLIKSTYAASTSLCRSTLMMLRPTRSPAFD